MTPYIKKNIKFKGEIMERNTEVEEGHPHFDELTNMGLLVDESGNEIKTGHVRISGDMEDKDKPKRPSTSHRVVDLPNEKGVNPNPKTSEKNTAPVEPPKPPKNPGVPKDQRPDEVQDAWGFFEETGNGTIDPRWKDKTVIKKARECGWKTEAEIEAEKNTAPVEPPKPDPETTSQPVDNEGVQAPSDVDGGEDDGKLSQEEIVAKLTESGLTPGEDFDPNAEYETLRELLESQQPVQN